jgi:predicted dithiol-disulfide oxidoreductase (DUF899 family)
MATETAMDVRSEIARLEHELLARKRRLAELWQSAPREEFPDYAFTTWDGGEVRLSELFGDRDDLVLVHNMGAACTYCTMWADGFNGLVPHLESRAAFVVVSPDPPAAQREFAQGRGWRFRMVSAHDSPFVRDAGFQEDDGGFLPGFSTFHRGADGKLYRVAHREFGPGDDFCATWHFFDLLEGGVKGWEPEYRYEASRRG